MSSKIGLLGPSQPDEPGRGLVALGVTAMHITAFFWLLGLGFAPEHALTLTVGIGLGAVTVIDRFLDDSPRNPR